MAQYEVSILEKHPSCGSKQANKKSLRKHESLAAHPHPPVCGECPQRTLEEGRRGPVAQRLLCLVQLCEYLKEPGNVDNWLGTGWEALMKQLKLYCKFQMSGWDRQVT